MKDRLGAEHALAVKDVALWAIYTMIRHNKTGRYAAAARGVWKSLNAEDRATLEGVARGKKPPP